MAPVNLQVHIVRWAGEGDVGSGGKTFWRGGLSHTCAISYATNKQTNKQTNKHHIQGTNIFIFLFRVLHMLCWFWNRMMYNSRNCSVLIILHFRPGGGDDEVGGQRWRRQGVFLFLVNFVFLFWIILYFYSGYFFVLLFWIFVFFFCVGSFLFLGGVQKYTVENTFKIYQWCQKVDLE